MSDFLVKNTILCNMLNSNKIQHNLHLYILRECLVPHNSPHLVDIGEGIELLVVMVVKRPFRCH